MHSRIVATFLFLLCLATPLHAKSELKRPNIILMMADDMGMGDTSAYQDFTGNADEMQLHTPAMERLAAMGTIFTDAHTPSSRCTPTRYGLLTGRYPWRSRMKWWVLFGSQGDPMMEADRPTIASLLKDAGYRTAMFGKWHVGLRYRQSNGKPAAGWNDADLTQPLHTTPLDHGFDVARYTSRSHGTSGPDAATKHKNKSKRNGPKQNIGPGHLHGRDAIAATRNGKQLNADGRDAYILTKLGSRHSDNAIEFMTQHVKTSTTKPFFLYYPANANHGPYTPDVAIGGKPVKGASRTKSGEPMDARHDLIYENDVALGRMIDWLEITDDPRNPGQKMIENTIVIFTSDNGAEKNSDIASGPFRSHKGSCYEGGHRVPFIVSWPAGGIRKGKSNKTPLGLQDLYATFAEIIDQPLPNPQAGEKGAEDSFSVLSAFRGRTITKRPPLFFNDHKEMKDDPAVAAMRLDSPVIDGKTHEGQWKIFFNAKLLREGIAEPYELFDLADDQWEKINRINDTDLQPLVTYLKEQALLYRNVGGNRLVGVGSKERVTFDWRKENEASPLDDLFKPAKAGQVSMKTDWLSMTITGKGEKGAAISPNFRGIGLSGGTHNQVDDGESLEITFDHDVIVESVAVVAGNGICGGFYQVGDNAPLAIYCVDADNDAKTQHGVISDIGVVKAGQPLKLNSSPHYGVESPGRWRLGAISVRLLK